MEERVEAGHNARERGTGERRDAGGRIGRTCRIAATPLLTTPGPLATTPVNVTQANGGTRGGTYRIAARRISGPRSHVAAPASVGPNDPDFAPGRHTGQAGPRGRERGGGFPSSTRGDCDCFGTVAVIRWSPQCPLAMLDDPARRVNRI